MELADAIGAATREHENRLLLHRKLEHPVLEYERHVGLLFCVGWLVGEPVSQLLDMNETLWMAPKNGADISRSALFVGPDDFDTFRLKGGSELSARQGAAFATENLGRNLAYGFRPLHACLTASNMPPTHCAV
jgi:hypothetical protein